jgi:hypothetical protein
VAIAFVSVLKFYAALKHHIAQHRPLGKIVALKIVVGLTFVEDVGCILELQIFVSSPLTPASQVIFWILRDTNNLGPTARLTYADVTIGIPALIICIQNVPLAIFFSYAYTCKPYVLPTETTAGEHPRYKGGFCGWKAWLAILNPGEVFRGLLFTFKMASLAQKEDHIALASDSDVTRREYYPVSQNGGNLH